MSDYPDPDEEYELMYADDLELLREEDDENQGNPVKTKPIQAKRSLDFSSPAPKNALAEKNFENNSVSKTNSLESNGISLTPSLQPMDDLLTPVNVSNKRTAEELFGDICDIDFDEVNLPSKRQKTEEENDLELIEKIIEQRKLRQMLLEPTGRLQSSHTNYDTKENMTLNIPRWPFLPLTNSDGDRVYVRLESEDSWDKSLEIPMELPSLNPTYAGIWEEARKILAEKQQVEIEQSQTTLPVVSEVGSDVNGNSLWVEKYKPESYLDLLSEEPVNRALLHWLHLWDKIVFKKEVKTKEPQQRNTFSKRTGQFQFVNKWRGKKDSQPEVDDDGRPHHKVALLCGPPGVGKTTLAHLLAKIAGYRPVELNASDERSTEAFRTALQNATLMRSVLDKDKRPNCLILDEIDGAPLPTVELLVKWCTATGTEPGKKKGKSQSQPLRRPVIAICNDLYATSLRPLRPVALVVQVGGVSLARLTARLSLVAVKEGLQVHPRALSALAARAAGDVRAAIQLLSFVRPSRRRQLTVEDVENAAIGTKDCTRSMMQALQAIFTVNDKDPQAVLKTIQAAGEYDRLADGIFENYLTSHVDSRLLIACETLSWLRLFDAVHSWTLKNQNYSLYGLLPMCCARCHSILASRTPHRVQFPSQGRQQAARKAEMDSIVHSVWRGSTPAVATTRKNLTLDILPLLPHLLSPVLRSANVQSLGGELDSIVHSVWRGSSPAVAPTRRNPTLEILPLLPHILSPLLRSANFQLCSESERKTLRTCAGAMCEYGLQYVQQRTPEGLYAFVMEPDVYRVAFYGTEERVRPPPAIRQAIAREQQLETIRRNEEMAGKVNQNSNSAPNRRKSTDVKEAKASTSKEMKEPALPNHLQRLRPKEVDKVKPQVHKDFFGRIVPLSQVHKQDAVQDVISSSSVFYQYREGFNNAVRRNVKTKDIL